MPTMVLSEARGDFARISSIGPEGDPEASKKNRAQAVNSECS